MRRLRLLALGVVLLGLAPGLLLRTETGARSERAAIAITPVPLPAEGVQAGPLRLTGVWQLTSPHSYFGGFSALVPVGRERLIAGTDRGFLLDLALGDAAPRAVAGSYRFVGRSTGARKEVIDLEALARDPASGTLWAAFEVQNTIERLSPGGLRAIARPAAMRPWHASRGPETMLRLADGRFLVIAEGSGRERDATRPALLFAGDPLAGAAPLRFRFASGESDHPVDATQLPDGRVVILLRRVALALPPRFGTAIAIADPAEIRAGAVWRPRIVQRLALGPLADNYEGIAVMPPAPGASEGTIWLIADDNFSVFQRSLLLRFAWPGELAVP